MWWLVFGVLGIVFGIDLATLALFRGKGPKEKGSKETAKEVETTNAWVVIFILGIAALLLGVLFTLGFYARLQQEGWLASVPVVGERYEIAYGTPYASGTFLVLKSNDKENIIIPFLFRKRLRGYLAGKQIIFLKRGDFQIIPDY